jgi:hypothetical protein
MSESTNLLTVDTPDGLSEIYVLNGRREEVAKGVGEKLEKEFAPGLYKVRVRVGSAVSDRLVSLDQNRTVKFTADELSYPTPVPLAGTSRSRVWHERAAREISESEPKVRLTDAPAVDRATILVFARDWSPEDKARGQPLTNLTLHDEKGQEILPLQVVADERHEGDVCAGVKIAVTPGAFRLRLTLPDSTASERSIITVRGWQTQVFLLMRDFGNDRRADLTNGAIAMSHEAFDPSGRGERAAVLARYALTHDRKLADATYSELFNLKFSNPILGLLAGHLLLRDSPKAEKIIDEVLKNLKGLIGTNHPDVQALELSYLGHTPDALRFPPLLRASWDAIVAASVTSKVNLAQGSYAEGIENAVVATEPWMVWRADEGRFDGREARLNALRDFLECYKAAVTKGSDAPRSRGFGFTSDIELDPSAALKGDPDTKVQLARSLGVTGSTLDSMLDVVSATQPLGVTSV